MSVLGRMSPDETQQASGGGFGGTTAGDGAVSKQQHLYKVLVIGDYAVGKTSIIRRYCEGYFTPNYKLTIGVDFALKGKKEILTTN
jgi:GTPase SAR1 family protein